MVTGAIRAAGAACTAKGWRCLAHQGIRSGGVGVRADGLNVQKQDTAGQIV